MPYSGGYNGPALAVFSIIGAVLQLPVIFAFGFTKRPNIALTILSFWFLYFCVSSAISGIEWANDAVDTWWSGVGWCDVDVRLLTAGSPGVLLTQCALNWEMLELIRPTPRVLTDQQHRKRSIVTAATVLSLPTIIFVVDTFFTYSRYQVVQYVGCSNNIDHSVAYIMCYVIWLFILGIICLVTMVVFLVRFYSYGQAESFEKVSFIPNMSRGQFIRLSIFSFVVTCVLCPMSMYMFSGCVTMLQRQGTTPLAWAHGKPENWDEILRMPFSAFQESKDAKSATIVLENNLAVKIILVALSWILFVCFGTSSFALMKYRSILLWFSADSNEDNESPRSSEVAIFDEVWGDPSKESKFSVRQYQLSPQEPPKPTWRPETTAVGTLLTTPNILGAPSKF